LTSCVPEEEQFLLPYLNGVALVLSEDIALYIYIFLRILWSAKKKVYIKDHKGLRFRIYIYSCPTRFRYLLKVRVQHRSSKGVGIAPLPKHMRSSLLFSGVRVAQSFVCCVVLWESLFFVLLFNFLWAGYYLSF
jgi:hypothetical protein